MKDYIDIYDKDGNIEKMEAVTIFKLEGYEFNYIIYRTLDQKHYYIAKYIGDDMVELNTDLNEEEMKLANKILESIIE